MPYPNWTTIGHGAAPRVPPLAVTTAPDAVVGRSPSAGAVYRRPFAKPQLLCGAGVIGLVLAAAVTAYANQGFVRAFVANYRCCGVPMARNAVVALREARGQTRYFGEIGQDKWVLETMFPDVGNGFFLDVGSGHGTIGSNTKALEQAGWKGICIDPFPIYMEGRTCAMFPVVVFSTAGRVMAFQKADGLSGLAETLGGWNHRARQAPSVKFTTLTLDDVLTRAGAPAFINFVSLDIEGAELEALKGFPFDRVRIGAMAIEHNFEEPKRSDVQAFLAQRGYARVRTWRQDDYYAPR